MQRTIKVDLSASGFRKAARELKKFQDELMRLTRKFLDELMERGISVSVANAGEYSQFLVFTKELTDTPKGVLAIYRGSSPQIERKWVNSGGVQSYMVSPIMLAEFGSGWMASDSRDGHSRQPNDYMARLAGMGQGTMPGQIHAFDPMGWTWTDLNGVQHHSFGEKPTMPMYRAYLEMMDSVDSVVREVFA